jgi:glycogen debranching enzyme
MSTAPSGRAQLIERARAVLDANWTGSFTKPALRQYPHQWSWDSAFIALGYARYDQARAEQELRSLFDGQWADGRVPHIVFHDAEHSEPYFPGPDFWQIERSPNAPAGRRTSGIVQPPIHATAVLAIVRAGMDRERALSFAAEMFPRLQAWHDWLYRERDPQRTGLIYICHPWESGQDNSPLWDPILARMAVKAEQVPYYRRADTRAVDPAERPVDADYDAYVFLVDFMRGRAYDQGRIYADRCPFLLYDVLFNTLLCRAEQDMAELARLIGADAGPHAARAEATAAATNTRLWDQQRGLYADYDLVSAQPVSLPVLAGFTPLFAGIPDRAQAEKMLGYLRSPAFGFGEADQASFVAATYDRFAPGYSPRRYWRGPVWSQMNWLMMHGLEAYGFSEPAARLRSEIVDLPVLSGFREYFDPETGAGYGAEDFSWTAALLIEVLQEEEHISSSR